MVAGDYEDVGVELQKGRDEGVQLLQRADLGVKVAVFACGVGGLVVDVEEVVLAVVSMQGLHLVGEGGTGVDDVHAQRVGQAPVHGVRGNGRGVQAVGIAHGR